MKKELFDAALREIDKSEQGDGVKFDIYFQCGNSATRLVNVTLEKIDGVVGSRNDGDLYCSTDNIGKRWYFSVQDVLMISKFSL